MTQPIHAIPTLSLCTSTALAGWSFAADAAASSAARDAPRRATVDEGEGNPLGTRAKWFLGVEDLLRITRTWSAQHYESGGGEEPTITDGSSDQTDLRLLWPSVAVDAFPVDRLSVGLKLGYDFIDSESRSENPDGTETGYTWTQHSLRVTPRVGYVLDLPANFALWTRIGATNTVRFDKNDWGEAGSTQVAYGLGVDGSVLATYSPGRFVTVFAGPGVSRPLWSVDKTTPDNSTGEWDSQTVDFYLTLGAGVRL